MATGGKEDVAKSPQLFELFSVPDSLFSDTLAGVTDGLGVGSGDDVDPGSFIRGFFQQDTMALTPTPIVDEEEVCNETSLDDEETKESLPPQPVIRKKTPPPQRPQNQTKRNSERKEVVEPKIKHERPSVDRLNSDNSFGETDKFVMEPAEALLRGPSLKLDINSDEQKAKNRVVASRSNSVRGGPQVRLGVFTPPTSFSPESNDSEIMLNENVKNKSRGAPKPLTLGVPARGLNLGGAGGKGGGLAARRGLMLNRTNSEPGKYAGKAPTMRERMRGGGVDVKGGAGGGGGFSLVIDTKSAHENRFSSAWEGVRLKAPSAVRLRQTKARSGEDSPTVLKLVNATKLCLKGLLLDLELRRFAALARELIRRGYAPTSGVIDYAETLDKNRRQRSSLQIISRGKRNSTQQRSSLMLRRRRSTATTLPSETTTGNSPDKDGMSSSFSQAPKRRTLMGSVMKSFSTNKEFKQPTTADGSDLICTAPLLKWMTEVYSGEVLNLAAKDLVQSVVHVTSAADREKVKAGMVVVLSEFEARLRCGLLNLTALVDTLVMLNLLPIAAAEAPIHSKFTTTLALLRQWCVGSLAVSHIALREVQRSQLQSLSPLQDASGDSDSEEERDYIMEQSFEKQKKKNSYDSASGGGGENVENVIDEEEKEKLKWGEEVSPRPSGVTFRSLSASSAASLWRDATSSPPNTLIPSIPTLNKTTSVQEQRNLSLEEGSKNTRPALNSRSGSGMLNVGNYNKVGKDTSIFDKSSELDLDEDGGESLRSSWNTHNGVNGDLDLDDSSLVDNAGNPKGIALDSLNHHEGTNNDKSVSGKSSEQQVGDLNKNLSSFDNFFSAAASFTAAAVSVARQAVGTKDIIDSITNENNAENQKKELIIPKIKIEVSPRRVRSLYEYIARFRARGTEEVSKHIQLRMQGRALSSLQTRLSLHTSRGSNKGRGGGSGGSHGSRNVSHGMTGPLKLEPVQHVWSIGDIHAEFKENMAWITEMPSHGNDALIVTGNVAASLTVLHRALAKLKRRFKYVFYVFGNQDLWTVNFEGDSVEKFFAILDLCDSLGVVTTPALLGEDLAIVPLFSWYNVRSPAPQHTHNHFASGSRPRGSVSIGGTGSRQRTGSWGDSRLRLSSDEARDEMGDSNHSGMMGGGSSSNYRYSTTENDRRRSSISSMSSMGDERRRSSNQPGYSDSDRRRSSVDGRSSSPRTTTGSRFWGGQRSSMNSGEATSPLPELSPKAGNENSIPFPSIGGTVATGAVVAAPVDDQTKGPSVSTDSDLTKDMNESGEVGNWGTAMSNQTSFGNRQLWFQLQRFRNVDAQCKWPLAIETAVPASAYRPPEYDQSGGHGSTQERGLFSAAAAAAVVSGASAFFHELNREAMGFDYGTRRVISASHFVPHDRLSNNGVVPTTVNDGVWPRPPPLTEEIERLNSTAHVFSGGGGETLSRVVALEGTCYMQHTIGYFNHEKYNHSEIIPRRDKTDTSGGLRSSLPSYASEEGDLPAAIGGNGSFRERNNSVTSVSSAGNGASGGGNRERSMSASGGGSFRERSISSASVNNNSFKLSSGRERSVSGVSNRSLEGLNMSIESTHSDEANQQKNSPSDGAMRRIDSFRSGQQVVAAIRRLQLIWDDNYFLELTTTVALEAVAVLKRGVPVVKHGRNRVAGGRTLYIVVTHHNADGSAASNIPTQSQNKDNPLTTYGTSSFGKNKYRSGLRGYGSGVNGRPSSVQDSDEESDSSNLSISSTSTNVKDDANEGGFTKVWLELGARRGSISSSAGTSGPKRLDLAHLRGVCVGRQTDTFRKSRRQPPPPPPNQTVGAVGQGEPGPGSAELCLSLIGGEGWAHRSVDLEFKSVVARDASLRFFRYEMRRLEQKRGMGLLPPAAAAAAAAARASAIAAAASVASASRRRRSTFL